MQFNGQNLQEEFLSLVHESCCFEQCPIAKYQDFHRTLLKFSFGAVDVKVNYENNTILIWNSKPSTDRPLKLRDFGDAMQERLSYTSLEETILGSMQEGRFHERFYRHLLYEYGDIDPKEDSVISA